MKFRDLRAEEIECRVQTIKPNGLSLLLYKDARCDMNILDEEVGAENWQREHYECKGNLFCRVGIKCKSDMVGDCLEWVWKSDCGTESNTEAQKGEASDSFKRACFNWGIGRELYTSPFIWISADDCKITEKNGKYSCFDKFVVEEVKIENKKIVGLSIKNSNTHKVVFSLGVMKPTPIENPSKVHIEALISTANTKGVAIEKLCKKYGLEKIEDISMAQYAECAKGLNKMPDVNPTKIYESVN